MKYLSFESLYEPFPIHDIKTIDYEPFQGIERLKEQLKSHQGRIIIETYPGIDLNVLKEVLLSLFKLEDICFLHDHALDKNTYETLTKPYITDDRVFGYKTTLSIENLYPKNLESLVLQGNPKVVFGFGASMISGDVTYLFTLKRWEHQKRMRAGMPNFNVDNHDEDILRKYKRAYFLEWVIADQLKRKHLSRFDYILEWNDIKQPKWLPFDIYKRIIKEIASKPFRMVPFFDPGVWGGQWMKEVCHLDQKQDNYAWCFDGVVEENSIAFKLSNVVFDMPAQDILDIYGLEVLGDDVFKTYGYHLPIRFDLLDTMDGDHLSLQVHPMPNYIHQTFGMPYTQHESYYILDAKNDGVVYLGFKEDIQSEVFEHEIKKASKVGQFDAERFVNVIPVKKHDHISIPAGTIHCSGRNTLVLEISMAAYIFTFKLWDWGRLGLDGTPRPVHLDHGLKNLQYDRKTRWVRNELINPISKLSENIERTGLHALEPLSSYRVSFKDEIRIKLKQTVQMATVVEGQKITLYHPSFESIQYHYAETFIIPANITEITLKCEDKNECMIIYAEVNV